MFYQELKTTRATHLLFSFLIKHSSLFNYYINSLSWIGIFNYELFSLKVQEGTRGCKSARGCKGARVQVHKRV